MELERLLILLSKISEELAEIDLSLRTIDGHENVIQAAFIKFNTPTGTTLPLNDNDGVAISSFYRNRLLGKKQQLLDEAKQAISEYKAEVGEEYLT